MRFRLFFLGILLSLPYCAKAAAPNTQGTAFWISFMENLPLLSNGQPRFSFFISSAVNTSGTIALPATGYTQSFTAAGGQVTEVFLPAGAFYATGSENIANCGFLVTTNDPVGLSVEHHRVYFSDASIVLPETELGDRYLVMAHGDDLNTGGLSEFVVEATQDNTVLDITPSTLTVGFHPAGLSFSVTLNKGQVYQVQANGDLSGTSVSARGGKKIAVFSGALYANVQCTATNHLYDEDYPLSSWGNEYMPIPLIPGYPNEVRILAAENNTQVFINCNAPVILNKGQFYDLQTADPVHITASAAVCVAQFKYGQDCSSQGDATLLICKPLGFVAHKAVFASMLSAAVMNQFDAHYVSILMRTANTALLALDNNPVAFVPVPQNPAYSYARVSLQAGTHTLLSDSGFAASAYGVGPNDSYSYFLGYDSRVSYANQLSIAHSDTLCTSSAVSFTANSSSGITSEYWNFGDGTFAAQQDPVHVYPAAGNYTVSLLAADAAGCPSTAQIPLSVEHCFFDSDCEVFVPDAFSPNQDQVNDEACVYGACIKEMEFSVYDRWGELVFHSDKQSACWDGTYKGVALNPAVFAWVLNATLSSGTKITKKGNLTLIR